MIYRNSYPERRVCVIYKKISLRDLQEDRSSSYPERRVCVIYKKIRLCDLQEDLSTWSKRRPISVIYKKICLQDIQEDQSACYPGRPVCVLSRKMRLRDLSTGSWTTWCTCQGQLSLCASWPPTTRYDPLVAGGRLPHVSLVATRMSSQSPVVGWPPSSAKTKNQEIKMATKSSVAYQTKSALKAKQY